MNLRLPLSERLFEQECKRLFNAQITESSQIIRELEDRLAHGSVSISIAAIGDEDDKERLKELLPELVALDRFYKTVLFRYLQKTQGVLEEGVQTLADFNVNNQSYQNQVDYFLERCFGIK